MHNEFECYRPRSTSTLRTSTCDQLSIIPLNYILFLFYCLCYQLEEHLKVMNLIRLSGPRDFGLRYLKLHDNAGSTSNLRVNSRSRYDN